MQSQTTAIIPFKERVVFVSLLNCAEFSRRSSEVAKALDTISGTEFLAGSGGLEEGWLLGPLCVRRCARVRQRRLRSFGQFTYLGHILNFLPKSVGYAAVFVVISYLLDPSTIGFERMVPLV
jgi:hypothetical protein